MKTLKSKICDTIYEETGIRLTPRDVSIKIEADQVVIRFWDNEVLTVPVHGHRDVESKEFAEDLLDNLFEEFFDLKEKIVELKLSDLNLKYRDEIAENLSKGLSDHKIDKKIIEVMDYEFVDLGYVRVPGANTDEEEWGFPIIGLRVTDFEELEYLHNIDVHQHPLKLDFDLLIKELVKKIRLKL